MASGEVRRSVTPKRAREGAMRECEGSSAGRSSAQIFETVAIDVVDRDSRDQTEKTH
jgi:hypothetical protein